MTYQDNRLWSDQFIPIIKRLVGPHLLTITPDEIDMTQAADLMVFSARDMRIAARVRRFGFYDRYPNEFTIRAKYDNGSQTELEKIVNGWGDWMFYAHANELCTGFVKWWLLDLSAFRAALIRSAQNGFPMRLGDKSNGDGTHFKWFDITSFPRTPPLVIAEGAA